MPSEAEIGRYVVAPSGIGNKESEVLRIARGVDNPGSVLVFQRHFPTILTRRGMILVALEWGGWRGRPGLSSFITSSPAGLGAPTINGVLWGDELEKLKDNVSIRDRAYGYIDGCCFLGSAGNLFGFTGNFIHEVMEGGLLLGFITLCSFLSSICGGGSGKGGVGEIVEFCPSSVFGVWVVMLSVDEDLVGEGGGKGGGLYVG